MWENKLPGAGCLHCVDDTYNWTDAMSEWLSRVNGATDDPDAQAGLGGHSDWRLPTIVELQTRFLPTGFYWSSTSNASSPLSAWNAAFDNDNGIYNVIAKDKNDYLYVRTVRGCR